METIAIFGVGLIGGSFALALRKEGFKGRIVGVSSPATLERALAAGAIDEALSPEDAARTANLIYLAQPISAILNTIPTLNDWVRPDALVTDAGSTKGIIVARANETLTRCLFIGGHPLAGKERRGVEHAEPDLFRGRTYVLTPGDRQDLDAPAAVNFLNWLDRIGARRFVTTPQRHDEVVAFTSHLPQLTATALASCLEFEFNGNPPPLWGPALLDSTRLGLSHFEIWGDILQSNKLAITQALEQYIVQLQTMQRQMAQGELEPVFDRAAQFARRLRKPA
jgi:prephenate dehydrogenase